jgi:glucose/arabinose dehydrogenase
VLPNGDVLVAETNAPPRPKDRQGRSRAAFMKMFMKKAGAAVPSANRITLLRDADGDGVAETRRRFLSGLNSPFGMALVGNDFYVANTDAVVRFPYRPARPDRRAGTRRDRPAAGRNHHWTKSLIASPDGTRLYRDGRIEQQCRRERHGRGERAAPRSGRSTAHRRQAHVRHRPAQPNGMAGSPWSGLLWTAVNERDELGSDLVPDYMTSVRDGGFYGWPFSYYGQHVDTREAAAARPRRAGDQARLCARAAHRLARADLRPRAGPRSGPRFAARRLRRPARLVEPQAGSGYKVIFVPFAGAGGSRRASRSTC